MIKHAPKVMLKSNLLMGLDQGNLVSAREVDTLKTDLKNRLDFKINSLLQIGKRECATAFCPPGYDCKIIFSLVAEKSNQLRDRILGKPCRYIVTQRAAKIPKIPTGSRRGLREYKRHSNCSVVASFQP